MAIHQIQLAYEITGKTSHARRATTHKIVEKVAIRVQEIDDIDALDGLTITIGGYAETLKFYDDRFWIRDKLDGPAAGMLRAQAGVIEDMRLATALVKYHSTFEVFHYRDPEIFADDFKSISVDELKDVNDAGRATALERLEKAAEADLIDIDGILYVALGEPVYCLRLLPDTLQVLVSFKKSNEIAVTSTPTIRIPIDDMATSNRDSLNALMAIWKAETGKGVTQVAEASLHFDFKPELDYSVDRQIEKAASDVVNRTSGIVEWSTAQITRWAELRDTLKSYRDKNADVYDLASSLTDYASSQTPEMRAYIRMLKDLLDNSPIHIPEISFTDFPQ